MDDPKELAKLYEKKNAESAPKAAEDKAKSEASQSDLKHRIEQGRRALRDVVIPYFTELQAAFPTDHFKFKTSGIDVEAREPVAVSFWIGEGAECVIQVSTGTVSIFYPNSSANDRNVYQPNANPFAGPHDLTRQKLGELVKRIIDKPR
jgi:hypothetical protein